jgi:hypothetical protein
MRRALISTFLGLFLATSSAEALPRDLPNGWRLPTDQELQGLGRDQGPNKMARANGDYNGDGIEDEALLLKSTEFSGEALWVWLSNGSEARQWTKLHQINWGPAYPNVDLAMGIETEKPGVYPYGCFCDAKSECNFGPHDKRPKLRLRDPAISYFKIDSAGSMYFWSRSRKRFLCVHTSD